MIIYALEVYMFRINPFSLRESLSKRTKEVGKLDDFIHSTVIPRGTNFPGFSLDSFIKPRIKFADNQLSSRNTFFRENIIRRMDSESPTSYHKSNKLKTEEKHSSIEFSSLFASGDPLRAVLYVENSDDNTALFHHIIFEWSNNRLWSDRFTHIFKIDLSSVLKSKFILDLSFMTNYEEFIAKLIHDSLDNECKYNKDCYKETMIQLLDTLSFKEFKKLQLLPEDLDTQLSSYFT